MAGRSLLSDCVCQGRGAASRESSAVTGKRAVPASPLTGRARFLMNFFHFTVWWAVLRIAVGLLAIMAGVAVLIWLCERRANPTQFGDGRAGRGFGAALWWAAVTMTTVGYGDVSPRTFKGRMIPVAWMFLSLVLVSTFTATMASAFTTEWLSQGSTIGEVTRLVSRPRMSRSRLSCLNPTKL